jgi:hypothetical protein
MRPHLFGTQQTPYFACPCSPTFFALPVRDKTIGFPLFILLLCKFM